MVKWLVCFQFSAKTDRQNFLFHLGIIFFGKILTSTANLHFLSKILPLQNQNFRFSPKIPEIFHIK